MRKEHDVEEITIKDIARFCNVGVSTVSRAINNHPDINPETKKMIMDTIRRHGYIPNNSARNLKRTDGKCIAVLVKGITNPFFADAIQIIEDEIKRKKYSMVIRHVESNEDEVDVALELVKEKRLAGIIFLGGYFSHSDEKLRKLHIPFILSTVGCAPDGMHHDNYSSLSVDDEKEGYRMTDYLIRQGHTRIAILAARPNDASIGKMRLNGYKRALKDHGIRVDETLICHMPEEIKSYSMESGYVMTRKLMDSGKEFTAIFALSDTMAVGACRAISEEGKNVPRDYSVAGFDGIELCSYYNPTLTTIRQPVQDIAEESVKLLFDILAGRSGHQHKIFPGVLLEQESTRKL